MSRTKDAYIDMRNEINMEEYAMKQVLIHEEQQWEQHHKKIVNIAEDIFNEELNLFWDSISQNMILNYGIDNPDDQETIIDYINNKLIDWK